MTNPKLTFQILTLFPDMFPGNLGQSLSGQALCKNIWAYNAINIRDFATDMHKTVDAPPFGGGAGMAPLRSHIFELFKGQQTKRKVSFWYGGRSVQELFYVEEFEAIEKEFDKKDLDTLEKNCKKVQTEIDTIKSSITWQWCSYPEEERMDLKEHFIDLLIRQ